MPHEAHIYKYNFLELLVISEGLRYGFGVKMISMVEFISIDYNVIHCCDRHQSATYKSMVKS